MINNDVLRRIRYTFDFSDKKMTQIFKAAEYQLPQADISALLKKEDDEGFKACSDVLLATFLNGLINELRGKKDGPQVEAEKRLTNNLIIKKLKIALNLQADDILALLALSEQTISKHELSAFFRKPGHKHYRECKDQLLRAFLNGMQLQYRENKNSSKNND